MRDGGTFRIESSTYEQGLPDLRRVREAVFVEEQGVPRPEWDDCSACPPSRPRRRRGADRTGRSAHAKHRPDGGDARDAARVGRRCWRRFHSSDSLAEVSPASQAARSALPGRVPGRRRALPGARHRAQGEEGRRDALNWSNRAAASAAHGVVAGGRRPLHLYARNRPRLLDQATCHASACGDAREPNIRICADRRRRAHGALVSGERLPSCDRLRDIEEQVDRLTMAFIANDGGGTVPPLATAGNASSAGRRAPRVIFVFASIRPGSARLGPAS